MVDGTPVRPSPERIERAFRKLYLQFGLKVLAGVVVLALIDLLPLPSKWWAIPFLLVGGWLTLVNLSALAALAAAQHRHNKGPDDGTPLRFQDHRERVVHVLSYAVLFIAMVAIMALGRYSENIVEEGRFTLMTGGLGVALAAFVTWWIKRTVPGYYMRNSDARGAAVVGLFVGIVLLTLLGSAWIDRSSAKANVTTVCFIIENTGTNLKSGSNYAHIHKPGKPEERFRIQLSGTELEKLAGLDSVDLRIGTGDLGFTHVLGVEAQ